MRSGELRPCHPEVSGADSLEVAERGKRLLDGCGKLFCKNLGHSHGFFSDTIAAMPRKSLSRRLGFVFIRVDSWFDQSLICDRR